MSFILEGVKERGLGSLYSAVEIAKARLESWRVMANKDASAGTFGINSLPTLVSF